MKPRRIAKGYPAGYEPDDERRDVFDPALKQYRYAFVKEDPEATEGAASHLELRTRLLWRSLQALTILRDEVVVRGGLTLLSWFPSQARPPHDIDLVVRDAALDPTSASAAGLLRRILQVVGETVGMDVPVAFDEITTDAIWTYERAEGRRISVPWSHPGTGVRDIVQVDVVFREPLQDPPQLGVIQRDRATEPLAWKLLWQGSDPSLWFASPAESLAWKLLWLETDCYPQGKDLYDAVLLAEHQSISTDLLCRVYAAKGQSWKHGTDTSFVRRWKVDWDTFARGRFQFTGSTSDRDAWLGRLASSLKISACDVGN